jgi:radial spoke head protein 4A
MMRDAIEALSYLDSAPENGVSVLTHVGEIYDKLLDFGADRPLDYFEPFSSIIKEEREPEKSPFLALREKSGPDFLAAAAVKSRIRSFLFPTQKLTAEGEEEEENGKEKQEEGGGGEEAEDKHHEEESNNDGEVPNVIGEMAFMSQFGVGLNPQETVLVQLATERLLRKKPLSVVRFWGKVFGADRDYYVWEAEYNEGARPHAESKEEEDKERKEDQPEKVANAPLEEDSGPNQFSYFVCNFLGRTPDLLPDVTPKQIVASRSIKQMFTGHGDAPVIAPPGRFEGTEQHLLRAVIARIVHSCTIAIEGMYRPEEEPEEDVPLESTSSIVLNEEWAPRPIVGLDSFVHRLPAILPQGRVEFWAPEAEEEEKERPAEKGPPILGPISADERMGDVPSWSLRSVDVVAPIAWAQPPIPGVSVDAGSKRGESHVKPETGKLFWLRSNAWPGLYVVASGTTDRIVMHYYGWAAKAGKPLEWPPIPEPKKKPPPAKEEEEEDKPEVKPPETNEEEDEADLDFGLSPKRTASKAASNAPPPDESEESGSYD